MQRRELEHLIRAAAAITDPYELMMVDSQSILGAVPDAPPELLQSMEADLYPLQRPGAHVGRPCTDPLRYLTQADPMDRQANSGTNTSMHAADPDHRAHAASGQCGAERAPHVHINQHYAAWLAEQNALFDTQGIWNDDLRVW